MAKFKVGIIGCGFISKAHMEGWSKITDTEIVRGFILNEETEPLWIEKTALKKIPDGKMIRIDVESDNNKIIYVKITGDFFLFPETAIDDIEDLFKDQKIPLNKEHEEKIIHDFSRLRAELVGVSIEDIIATIEEALQ